MVAYVPIERECRDVGGVQRRGDAGGAGVARADREHVGCVVDAFDVETGFEVADQQPAGAAGELQCGSVTRDDRPLEQRRVVIGSVVRHPCVVGLGDEPGVAVVRGDVVAHHVSNVHDSSPFHLHVDRTTEFGSDGCVLTWNQFAAARPDLAETGRGLLYQYAVGEGYLATLRADGAPRVRPDLPAPHRRRPLRVPDPVTETRRSPARRSLRAARVPATRQRRRVLGEWARGAARRRCVARAVRRGVVRRAQPDGVAARLRDRATLRAAASIAVSRRRPPVTATTTRNTASGASTRAVEAPT